MRACTLCLVTLVAVSSACTARPRGPIPIASASSGAPRTRDAAAKGTTGAPDAGRPTFFYEFRSSDSAYFDPYRPFGAVTFGADPGAHDGNAADLVFDAKISAIGPTHTATEIITKSSQTFGEYRFRVRLATCRPNEDLVNGLFTYFNDGKDHDGDGLVDNDEIDIEILCAQPSFLNMTSWTEYSDDHHMRKKSRIVDLDTGTIYVGRTDGYGKDPGDPLNGTVDPALSHPGWYHAGSYYEMGWDWQPNRIRWFIVLGGREVTLWTLTDAVRIPKEPSTLRFNLWHPKKHWNEAGLAMTPAKDATLSIDWLEYTAGK